METIRKMAGNKRGHDGELGGRRCLCYSVEGGTSEIWESRVDTSCSFPSDAKYFLFLTLQLV